VWNAREVITGRSMVRCQPDRADEVAAAWVVIEGPVIEEARQHRLETI
jgi:hypothetical protein